MSNLWIPVDGYENLPVGEWLVYMPEDTVNNFHVALARRTLVTIGGYFGFDRQKITHYQALPESPNL